MKHCGTGMLCIAAAVTLGCGGRDAGTRSQQLPAEPEQPQRTYLPEGSRCEQVVPPEVLAAGSADPNCTPRVESVEADLDRDGHMDMRRVYLLPCPTMLGEDIRPQILCRESDLNFDGRKDIFRHFKEGVAQFEEQDIDFDGRIDCRIWFADGNPASFEFDRDGDGRFEMQVLLQQGRVRRVKVDVVGDQHYDIYETYEVVAPSTVPQLISIGYDVQGDGTMDRLLMATEAEAEEQTSAAPAAGEE